MERALARGGDRVHVRAADASGDAPRRARCGASSAIPTVMNIVGPLANPARRRAAGGRRRRRAPASRSSPARCARSAPCTRSSCTASRVWTRSRRSGRRSGRDPRRTRCAEWTIDPARFGFAHWRRRTISPAAARTRTRPRSPRRARRQAQRSQRRRPRCFSTPRRRSTSAGWRPARIRRGARHASAMALRRWRADWTALERLQRGIHGAELTRLTREADEERRSAIASAALDASHSSPRLSTAAARRRRCPGS